jgi:type III secretion protein S
MEISPLATYVQNTLTLVLVLSAPALVIAIAIGFLIGLFQAVTQIQDQALPQACKIIAVLVSIALIGRMMSSTLIEHTNQVFDDLPLIGRSVVPAPSPPA